MEEKELHLEKLQQEVKEKQKAKDEAVLMKDEAAVSHQAELGVSVCMTSLLVVDTPFTHTSNAHRGPFTSVPRTKQMLGHSRDNCNLPRRKPLRPPLPRRSWESR